MAGPLNEKQLHGVTRIRAASDHLLTLIEEILTFARQQAGRAELRLSELDIAHLVRDTASLVEPLAAARGLGLALNIPAEPIRFRTDAGKVRQIILNLAANAVKFTDAGEVRLDLEALADGSVLLRVSDTGIGIAAEHAEHVFSAFWQVDDSSGRLGGTGLGLAVTRQVACMLGGDVTMESELGRGSVFTVILPALPAAPEIPGATDLADLSQPEQRVKGRRRAPRRGAKPVEPVEPQA
jgi:signal transduction histidine kinase